jgi:taurine dioxygenase
MRVVKVAGALGAEVSGVDLGRGVASGELRAAFLEHGVLFFRDQPLTLEQFTAFARTLGEPVEYPFVRGLDAYPWVIEVKKLEHERTNFGGVWHSDTTYLAQPPMATLLLAREVPPHGGDTLFASQTQAYDALSDTMKRMLHGLRAVSSSAKADVSRTREDRIRSDGRADVPREYRATHPLVRTHPETGRPALFVNVAHTVGIEGLTDAEGAGLLQFLFAHQVRPEFTCRFAWRPGSLALWDNRCTLHNPVNDYHGYRRVMHRITLRGDTPA